ncbi:CocE/NonD family hydrolase [Solimonas sp. K1W22B-7]|uniref:CocE/NonD family hydrolase n=1 Tax=Solimonas sp. K1W22B-7 TaxID=2303331 RepID=UPI0013C45CDB|nr:CocE/NonD family hydrolase [Solimonas sp. K1W22B-7]
MAAVRARSRRGGFLLFAILWLTLLQPAAAEVRRQGYITLRDGVTLHYNLALPAGQGNFPTVFIYDPYEAGAAGNGPVTRPYVTSFWAEHGYAAIGVNIRGTGCSGGTFRAEDAPEWAQDGAEVVDWIAAQPWSNGSVGMFGISFTGTSQFAVAALASPHLKAIAPWQVFPDFYRDMAYPGGIYNSVFVTGWGLVSRPLLQSSGANAGALGDVQCLANILQSLVPNLAANVGVQMLLHPYRDDYWSRDPSTLLPAVRLPALGCVTWQDSTVTSRAADLFADDLMPDRSWLVANNGPHGGCAVAQDMLLRFYGRYLKGEANGWERTPRLTVHHEVPPQGDANIERWTAPGRPAWTTTHARFDGGVQPLRLRLQAGGRLDQEPAAKEEQVERYLYPSVSANTAYDWLGAFSRWGWPQLPGTTLSYTTPPLAQDAEFLGSGSADLWMSALATDMDVQLTLSEVRPDGQEMYIQNGWLRASHRRLDESRSTRLRPWHTHLSADAEALRPGEPVLLRIQMLPFNHVFRAGSSIRLAIDTPNLDHGARLVPSVNAVHLGGAHDSLLVLGWLPGARAGAPLPDCMAVKDQPCRADRAGVPDGSLRLSADRVQASGDSGGGALDPLLLILLLAALLRRQRRTVPFVGIPGALRRQV